MKPLLSRLTILCPCYNEAGLIGLFFQRLQPVIERLSSRYRVQVVFLNNASTDGTLAEILELRSKWPHVYVATMSRNVGYQRSLECGLRNIGGDLFVFIDVDCEDPPELIIDFVAKHEDGYDIVYGERVDRDENAAVKMMRKFFYRLLRRVADEEIILDMAEFALFTSEVREAILQDMSSFPFIRSSIGRIGFRRYGIPFKRQRRIGGRTHYNLFGMAMFAIAGILAASTLLLRLPLYVLPFWIAALIAIGYAYTLSAAPWLAVTGAILFAVYIGSALAVISLYVARSYKNGLLRPNAFMSRRDTYLPAEELAAQSVRTDPPRKSGPT
jgi:dolichol-phosphate mannosyltransferase